MADVMVDADGGLPSADTVAPEGVVYGAVLAQNIAGVAEYRGTAAEVDEAFEDDALVSVSEVIAGVMWAGEGREFPQYDDQMIAVLDRDGTEVSVAAGLASAGHVLQTTAGRLAVSAGGRATLESTGDALALVVDAPADRYVRAWRMPRVQYAGGRS